MDTLIRDRQLSPQVAHPQPWSPAQAAPQTPDPEAEVLRRCAMGGIYIEMGRYQSALDQFEQALAMQPHHGESWIGRAEALACLNRYDESLASLDQAQALAGVGEVRLWVQKAVVLILLNRPRAALSCCNQALWLAPDHTQAWLFRGVALQRLGQFKSAYRSYERASHPVPRPAKEALRLLWDDLACDRPRA